MNCIIAPELEAKLLARVQILDVSAKDVEQMVVTWPVDFFAVLMDAMRSIA